MSNLYLELKLWNKCNLQTQKLEKPYLNNLILNLILIILQQLFLEIVL